MKNINFFKTKGIFVLLLALMFVLAACGGSSSESDGSSSSDSNTGSSSSEGSNDSSDSSSDETFTLQMNVAFPAPVIDWEPKQKGTEHFVKAVEERTNGRVKIDIYYNNQLAGQAESLDALTKGTFDIQVTTPTAWADRIPESGFATMPFWNYGPEYTTYMLRETDLGKLYEEALENYGVKLLFYWQSDESGYMSTKPIQKPEDLKGLKVNNTSAITIKYYESMGAATANIPFTDLYESLLRGTLDSIVYPFSALESYKFKEVVDYITVPGQLNPSFGIVVINQDKWNSLPEDLQEIITEVAMEMEAEALESSLRLSEYSKEIAKENDIEILEISEEDRQKFLEIAQETAWEEFANISDRAKQMIEIIIAESEKYQAENN